MTIIILFVGYLVDSLILRIIIQISCGILIYTLLNYNYIFFELKIFDSIKRVLGGEKN